MPYWKNAIQFVRDQAICPAPHRHLVFRPSLDPFSPNSPCAFERRLPRSSRLPNSSRQPYPACQELPYPPETVLHQDPIPLKNNGDNILPPLHRDPLMDPRPCGLWSELSEPSTPDVSHPYRACFVAFFASRWKPPLFPGGVDLLSLGPPATSSHLSLVRRPLHFTNLSFLPPCPVLPRPRIRASSDPLAGRYHCCPPIETQI
jgi:hypothetical protein